MQSLLAGAQDLATELSTGFRHQVERALQVQLDDSPTSLAFVDHHLKQAHAEDRAPIIGLLAAGAGAFYGELVRARMGGTWIGEGRDPRRLRLLLAPTFLHFSPIDQAIEAIAGTSVEPDDERIPEGPPFDPAFHLRPPPPEGFEADDGVEDDASWLQARLAELSPVPEDQFYSLTCRFETLQLMLELLAAKHVAEGRSPKEHGPAEYLEVLTRRLDG